MSDSNKENPTHQQETLDLSIALLERPSVTPDDDGCQDMLSERLAQAGLTASLCILAIEIRLASMLKSKTYGRAVVQPIQLFVSLGIRMSCQRAMKTIGLIHHLHQLSLTVIYGLAVLLT